MLGAPSLLGAAEGDLERLSGLTLFASSFWSSDTDLDSVGVEFSGVAPFDPSQDQVLYRYAGTPPVELSRVPLNSTVSFSFSAIERPGLGLAATRLHSQFAYLERGHDFLQIWRCHRPGFAPVRCPTPDGGGPGTAGDCELRFEKEGRGYGAVEWGRFGWLALTRAKGSQIDPLGELLVGVANIDTGALASLDLCGHRSADAMLGPFLPAPDLGRRVSITPHGLRQRDKAIHATSTRRARIVFQTGVESRASPRSGHPIAHTVDDALAVMDLCIDARTHGADPVLGPCPLAEGETAGTAPPVPLARAGGWAGQPSFSPDGRWLAYLRGAPHDPGAVGSDESQSKELWVRRNLPGVRDLAMNENAVNLTGGLDRSVLEFEWGCNSRCLLVKLDDQGDTPILQLDYQQPFNETHPFGDLHAWQRADPEVLRTQLVFRSPSHELVKEFEVSITGRHLYLIATALGWTRDRVYRCARAAPFSTQPFEPWQKCEEIHPRSEDDVPGISVRRLGDFLAPPQASDNAALDDRADVASGAGDGSVPGGFAFLPPCYWPGTAGCPQHQGGEFHPAMIFVHGGPHEVARNEFDHLRHRIVRGDGNGARLGGAGFILLAPDLSGSSGYGRNFRNATTRQWGGAAFEDLESFLALVARDASRLRIDVNRVYVMGESFGGYLVNLLQARGDQRRRSGLTPMTIAGALNLYGVFDLRRYPCKTDQKWFPYHEFGYFEQCHEEEARPQSLYRAEFDPNRYFECFGAGPARPECAGIADRSPRAFPVLAVHGASDTRVCPSQSWDQVGALSAVGRDTAVGTAPVPVRACEVSGRDAWHGFRAPQQDSIYRAMMSFFRCLDEGGEADECVLDSGPAQHRVDCSVGRKREWIQKSIWRPRDQSRTGQPPSERYGRGCADDR